jgi:hypothetical protein
MLDKLEIDVMTTGDETGDFELTISDEPETRREEARNTVLRALTEFDNAELRGVVTLLERLAETT